MPGLSRYLTCAERDPKEGDTLLEVCHQVTTHRDGTEEVRFFAGFTGRFIVGRFYGYTPPGHFDSHGRTRLALEQMRRVYVYQSRADGGVVTVPIDCAEVAV